MILGLQIAFALALLVTMVIGGLDLAAYLVLLFFIGSQSITVLYGLSVIWTDYSCAFVNKIVYAAYAFVSAAIMVRIGFYLIDALNEQSYDAFNLLILLTVIGLVEPLISTLAKHTLLNIPLPWQTDRP